MYAIVSFLNWAWSMGLPEGTPRQLAIATKTFAPLFVLFASVFLSGACWPMPVRAFVLTAVGTIITGFAAMITWCSSQGYQRDKRLLVELLAAELAAGPQPDPASQPLRPAA